MKQNVGTIDKIVRILLAVIIGIVGYINQSWWGLVAIVPLATAFIGFCPAYAPFKINTGKKKG